MGGKGTVLGSEFSGFSLQPRTFPLRAFATGSRPQRNRYNSVFEVWSVRVTLGYRALGILDTEG